MKKNLIFSRLKGVAQRHNMSLVQGGLYEMFILLYKRPLVRALLKRFFPVKEPAGWFFLVGCYNSGTTVIKDALALHPAIAVAPIEGDRLTSGLPSFEEGGWPRSMIANTFLIEKHRKKGKLNHCKIQSDWRPWIKKGMFYLEKSISNSVRVGLLRKEFQGSKFICIFRDPNGVIKGIKKRSVPSAPATFFLEGEAYTDEHLKRQWDYVNSKIVEDYQESDSCFCNYDDFLIRPVEVLSGLYQFLGLPEVEVRLNGDDLSVGNNVIRLRRAITPNTVEGLASINEIETMVSYENKQPFGNKEF